MADDARESSARSRNGRLASGPGEVRLGPMLALPRVLVELGVDPELAFERAGVDGRLFEDSESRMNAAALGRLLEQCAELTQCEHFGLLVGSRFRLSDMGPLGYLILNSPTVGDALRCLRAYLKFFDRAGAAVLLSLGPQRAMLGYSLYRHDTPGAAHALDASVAIGAGILAELCGPDWKPKGVKLGHHRPRSDAAYLQVFRTRVQFDAQMSGIEFASNCLAAPIAGADPNLRNVLAKAIADAQASTGLKFADRVRDVLHQFVLGGPVSAEAVAAAFAIHERTLRRRLEDEHTTLNRLLAQTRFELAQQLLRDTDLPVSEIGTTLQYQDSNAFTRAFRGWAGESPSRWRAQQRAR